MIQIHCMFMKCTLERETNLGIGEIIIFTAIPWGYQRFIRYIYITHYTHSNEELKFLTLLSQSTNQ